MTSPAEGINTAKTGWQRLDISQKMITAIIVTLFLTAIGLLFYRASHPSYTVLFSSLRLDDTSTIIAKLQEYRIPYRVNGTRSIEIPSDRIYEARIKLAGEGLPRGDAIGDALPADVQENYTKTQLGTKDAYENSLERSIESMLSKVLGGENSTVVRVSADIDFTETEIQTNRVERGKSPIIESEQIYEFTRINEHKIKPPGTVKKLSVAVVVNNDGRDVALNDKIEDLVAAAAGIDTSRGDVLTISSIPFSTEWVKREEQAIVDSQKRAMYANYGKYATIAVLFIIGLFALLKVVSSFTPAWQSEELTPRPISGLDLSGGDDINVSVSDPMPERRKWLRLKGKERQLTRVGVRNLAKERPGDFAKLMRVWLNT